MGTTKLVPISLFLIYITGGLKSVIQAWLPTRTLFLIFVLAYHYLPLVFKRNDLQKLCCYATILYTIFTIMRSPYRDLDMTTYLDEKSSSRWPISLRGERTFMTTYLTTYGAKIEKSMRAKVARNKWFYKIAG